jgi:hypothetical protein
MEIINHFPANYSVTTEVELPPSGQQVTHFNYRATQAPSHGLDGPLVRIEPISAPPWLAVFGGGYAGSGILDAIYTTPRPTIVCIVCRGAGYLVDAVNKIKEDVPTFPIRQAVILNELLVFADFTRLAAYGAAGIAWVSEPLVSDRLVVSAPSPEASFLTCRGLDAATQKELEVEVDVYTGRVIGNPEGIRGIRD